MQTYESREMYLETILELKEKNGNVRSVDLVNAMGFAKSSVSEGLKSLRENNYIEMDQDGLITLTTTGDKIAHTIYERHLVLTEYFKRIGVSPVVAEQDACKIEHVISSETFDAIKKHGKNKLNNI